MRGSVLTLSCPLGSPRMVGSAPSSPVYESVGWRLADFVSHWLRATDDAYVLRTVSEGIRLEFLERPSLTESLILVTRNAKREAELCHHVEEMVSKEALELAPLPSPGFYSNLFLVPKKSRVLRPVINLKPLNLFIKKEKFKIETTRSIRKALSPGDWVTSIDLKDAYFHILVHPDFRKYLRIVVGGKVFQFQGSAFRTVTSPKGVLSGHRSPGHSTPQTHNSIFICTWTIGSSEPC